MGHFYHQPPSADLEACEWDEIIDYVYDYQTFVRFHGRTEVLDTLAYLVAKEVWDEEVNTDHAFNRVIAALEANARTINSDVETLLEVKAMTTLSAIFAPRKPIVRPERTVETIRVDEGGFIVDREVKRPFAPGNPESTLQGLYKAPNHDVLDENIARYFEEHKRFRHQSPVVKCGICGKKYDDTSPPRSDATRCTPCREAGTRWTPAS